MRVLARLCVLGCTVLVGCTDLRVDSRVTDLEAGWTRTQGFRFASAPLQGVSGTSASTRAADAAARAAIEHALARHGIVPGDAQAPLLIDFTLRDVQAANVRRLDGPADYRRSWRAGSAADGTGAMDHTVADAAMRRELELTVILIPAHTGRSAWEGRASRSVPLDHPDEALAPVLTAMARRLFEELPAEAAAVTR